MKSLITFVGIFLASSTFAQQDMFWNNYSNYNPAMSGFQYQQHAALSYADYFLTDPGKPASLTANYNIRLAEKHGLGINYFGVYDHINNVNYLANYNYQFNLKNTGRLSAGIGVGFNHIYDNPNFVSPYYNGPLESRVDGLVNLGVAYKWKGLTTGLSFNNRIVVEAADNKFKRNGLNALVEYDFALGEQFQLTPRIIYGVSENGNRGGLSTDLTLAFRKKFSLGATYSVIGSRLGIHAGWNITDRFRIAYMFNTELSNLNTGAIITPRHQFTLGYMMK